MSETPAAQNILPAQEASVPAAQDAGRVIKLLRKQPTVIAAGLFVLMLSGPPRLRFRDLDASLRGETDWVVFFHIGIWGLAGFWVLLQVYKRMQARLPVIRLRMPQILGLALVLSLSISILTSEAPSLTAFKVYQVLVSLVFTQIFVERFGAQASLKTMLLGNALLCLAIAICAFVAPEMVWTVSEADPQLPRLYGELIASTDIVSVFAIILLLTTVRRIWRPVPLSLVALFFCLLVLSLTRTAYLATLLFLALVIVRRPNMKPLRQFSYCFCAFLLLLFALGQIPSLSRYRSPETVWTLSDRVGLWSHLAAVTLDRSPWFGLGYYSASRIHGPEYNPLLGNAHSMFVEVLAGGGLVSVALFLALCVTLSIYAGRLLYLRRDRLAFAFSVLFIACIVLGFMGETIDSGPLALAFWCSASVLPRLHKWPLRAKTPIRQTEIHATA